jgi:hypothetical protein
MKLTYVLVANSAQLLHDGLINVLGGGVHEFSATGVPKTVPVFYVVARAYCTPEERGKRFPYEAEIHDPKGDLLPQSQIRDMCGPARSFFSELSESITFLLEFQGITFPVFGLYTLYFRLGDLDPVEIPILIHEPVKERPNDSSS